MRDIFPQNEGQKDVEDEAPLWIFWQNIYMQDNKPPHHHKDYRFT